MKKSQKSSALKRAMLVATIIVGLGGGMAFGLLQSQPGILQGNSIQTAIAGLQVSPNGTTYSNVMSGYGFGNLIPGGQPSPISGYPVYVKNVGTSPLNVKLSINSAISNPDNVDLSKVHLVISPTSGGAPQNITLQDLITAHATGGVALNTGSHVIPTQVISFLLQVTLDSDAINGPSATLSNIDFNFGATAVN